MVSLSLCDRSLYWAVKCVSPSIFKRRQNNNRKRLLEYFEVTSSLLVEMRSAFHKFQRENFTSHHFLFPY
jgi:hypothetical protein